MCEAVARVKRVILIRPMSNNTKPPLQDQIWPPGAHKSRALLAREHERQPYFHAAIKGEVLLADKPISAWRWCHSRGTPASSAT